jgi:predicted dehydrogenase
MLMMSENFVNKLTVSPSNIAVIGGGRWARVIAEVLCNVAPLTSRISVHSPRNAAGMSAWVAERGLERRVSVSSGLPEFPPGSSSAVIIANAVRDHEKSIEWALSEGIPVLVEKPLTLSLTTAQRLASLAASRKTYFAAAHVFLFARYLDAFAKYVVNEGKIQSMQVRWMDPKFESRHGEQKSYDSGLPIYADWMPHIISMLGAITPCETLLCENLQFLHGGSHVDLDIMLDGIPCAIQMVRNGDSRERIIEVHGRHKTMVLDFATEPGRIISDSTILSGDMEWEGKPKPVAAMLGAFLQGAAGGMCDRRLDIAIGLRASRAIDQVSSLYCVSQSQWLSKALLMPDIGSNSDLCYTLSEILNEEDPNSSAPIRLRIDYVCRYFKENVSSLNRDVIERPVELIKSILKQGKLSSYS